MGKQSANDRKYRLEHGQCPIHGRKFRQIKFYTSQPCAVCGRFGVLNVEVGCYLKECNIRAMAVDFINGPWILLPEFSNLIKD